MRHSSLTTTTTADGAPGWRPVLINLALFQLCWLGCVLSGAAGFPLIAIVLVAAVAAYHLYRARRPLPEALLLVAAGIIGALWDGQLAGYGWLIYPSGQFAQWLAPSWIIAMWVSFATTLNVTMRWLHGRYVLAALFGLIGGPLAFWAGERLGGVQFSDTALAMGVLGIGWALITPMLVALAMRLDGFRLPASAKPTHAGAGAEEVDQRA